MRASESLAFAYFSYLAIVCWLRPLSRGRRVEIAAVAAAAAAAIVGVARHAPSWVRDWAPVVYLLIGYYLPGRFFETPSIAFERWLAGWDRRLLGDPSTRFGRWPRPLVAYLDIVYMACFLMLPGGFAVLAASGRSDLADHYWTLVEAADMAAFLSLTIVQTRPPWALEQTVALGDRAVHRAALVFVRHGTIGANTFPSGHTAVSLAIAYALLPALPIASLVTAFLAVTIACACVVGRYHYAVDVITGALLSVAVWILVALWGV